MMDTITSSMFDHRLDTNRKRLMQEFISSSGLTPMSENFSVIFSSRCEGKFDVENPVLVEPVTVSEEVMESIFSLPKDMVKTEDVSPKQNHLSKKTSIILCYQGDTLMGCRINGEYIPGTPGVEAVPEMLSLPDQFISSVRGDALVQLNDRKKLDNDLLIKIPKIINANIFCRKEVGTIYEISTSDDMFLLEESMLSLIIDPYTLSIM